MAAKVIFDANNKLILVGSGIRDLDVQIDIYSDAKEDWLVSSELIKFPFPLEGIGGDPITGEKFVTPRFFLASGWRIKPDEANHELLITGDLFSDLPRQGLDAEPLHTTTSGSFTVAVVFNRTFDAFTTVVETSGTGVTTVGSALNATFVPPDS
jgi:hypothetical protein